jgi:phospholipid transport system substrate-binding protein
MKKTVLTVALALGLSGIAVAQPYYPGGVRPYGMGQTRQQPGPAVTLRQGLNKLTAFAGQNERPSEAQIAVFLDDEIAPYFDFSYMARWARGQAWKRMSEPQRQAFEKRLKAMFLGALAQRLTRYQGQQVRVLGARKARGNEVDVGVLVQNPRGYPARLKFRFYRAADGWKVFDVAANGSSALMHYRQHFKRTLRRDSQPRQFRGM